MMLHSTAMLTYLDDGLEERIFDEDDDEVFQDVLRLHSSLSPVKLILLAENPKDEGQMDLLNRLSKEVKLTGKWQSNKNEFYSDHVLIMPEHEAPHIYTCSNYWVIYARDLMILIFSIRAFVTEDPTVQRDLLKIWPLFREMGLKALSQELSQEKNLNQLKSFLKNAVSQCSCEGCSVKQISSGKSPDTYFHSLRLQSTPPLEFSLPESFRYKVWKTENRELILHEEVPGYLKK